MNFVFAFFLRLFICFVAAKLLVQAVDLDGRIYLLSLTILFLINVYLFDFLVFRDRRARRESPPEAASDKGPEEPPARPDA